MIWRSPPRLAARRFILASPCPSSTESGSNPRPLSVNVRTSHLPATLNSTLILGTAGVANDVVDAFFEDQESLAAHIRPQPEADRPDWPDWRRITVKLKIDVAPAADFSGEAPHRPVKSLSRSHCGLIAQTMSLIASTDSREILAMSESCCVALASPRAI